MRRCEDCGCFVYRISEDNYTCCNDRCESSWQTTERQFDSSLLGAAIRQLVGAAPPSSRLSKEDHDVS